MKEMFISLQKMGGTAINKMFDRLFIETMLEMMDKLGVGSEDDISGV
jgi:hypothetical protein